MIIAKTGRAPASATHAPPLPAAALPVGELHALPQYQLTTSSGGLGRAGLGPVPGWGSTGERGEAAMCDLVARTGRHLQRYEGGRRLVAGCVGRGRPPFPITNRYQSLSLSLLFLQFDLVGLVRTAIPFG
jgi:hypothetical protein